MLEITGQDIGSLDDTNLRTLIGLLCEAELYKVNIATMGVTYGGDQNAADGGIDVRVEVSAPLNEDGYIPRSTTGFQVKKPDMPRRAILQEMQPHGELREVIKELISKKGAYIIISSQGSTSDTSLANRRLAMRNAIQENDPNGYLKIDFYDRERIANWVRMHPALILWVRDKIGNPIQGWKGFGTWTHPTVSDNNEYFSDEHIRLYNVASNSKNNGSSILDGINDMRAILSKPGSSIRLVGLSGVGKTRLVQALFEKEVGESALSPSQVFYADLGDAPLPDPRNFAERLITLKKPLILIVDNCPPNLHKRLTSLCTSTGSLISLLTIEYDVKDDQPEETEVFRLQPSSKEIIEKIILNQFYHITNAGARLIADFSGGNARIAIALAKVIKRDDDISRLRDSDLFERLFQQRNKPDNTLLKAAEVCSLVYSFSIDTSESEQNELTLLGSLASLNVNELYAQTGELKRRDLVQQRGNWRAVLPPVIANRLADKALQDIPSNLINNSFLNKSSDRLKLSFFKRLGLLHNSEIAKSLIKDWLSKNSFLGDVEKFGDVEVKLFLHIAPINPELVLSTIERIFEKESQALFLSRENPYFREFSQLLRHIAYDDSLFERSILILTNFALSEKVDENNDSIRRLLKSMFYIYLSGTHASAEQRLKIISNLIYSNQEDKIELGLLLLSATLEAWHFISFYTTEFGARMRDYGWQPKNKEEISNWYDIFLEYSVELISSNHVVASKVKSILAEKLRALWSKAYMHNEIEVAVKTISSHSSWNEGLIAVKSILKFDSKNMSSELISKLEELVIILEPKNIVEKIKLYTLSSRNFYLDLLDFEDVPENLNAAAQLLGNQAANQNDILYKLLPELLVEHGLRIFDFGKGLAQASQAPEAIWDILLRELQSISENKRNHQILQGFLNGLFESNRELCNNYLDDALTNKTLSKVFPLLQISVVINKKAIERLENSLIIGDAPIWIYNNLALGRMLDDIDDDSLISLLKKIASKTDGNEVAIHILSLLTHGKKKEEISKKVALLGQELIVNIPLSIFLRPVQGLDYKISEMIKYCFVDEAGERNAWLVAKKIFSALSNGDIYIRDLEDTLKTLASAYPIIFLDTFFGKSEEANDYIELSFSMSDLDSSSNPISLIKDAIILQWCKSNPEVRELALASAIIPYQFTENQISWTSLAMNLIENSIDPIAVLQKIKRKFRPMSWNGSRAAKMEQYIPLIAILESNKNHVIAEWSSQEKLKFQSEILTERKSEEKYEKSVNERFE
ncbi:hypothetical protein [Paenibacillus bovis]|uniref:Uncharacterized protein n=1 Tax=Paenibacillus bovis TaxID=1616788 RepID=A0A172ZJI2_9BACL|nr:hypothetical protein [Paenibacillus bovis]ANF97805.1 hypothetical protein AR543_18490 [Paenibacillus bovis]